MKNLGFLAAALSLLAIAIVPAAAQQRSLAPHLSAHAVNPSISLSTPATSPLQQQMQDDYATQLMESQRDLLQQNPSGTTPQELAIGHELEVLPRIRPMLPRQQRADC
jgi:hypothetical protein